MKTIGEIIHQKKYALKFIDIHGNLRYIEDDKRFWTKRDYDSNGYETLYENANGYVSMSVHDDNGVLKSYEDSHGYTKYFEEL